MSSLDRRPTGLGTAHAFVPSATDGRVWLAGTDCDRAAMVGVREVSVDGRVTLESDRRVPGSWVAGAVPDGLAVLIDRELAVWDPDTGRRDLAVVDTATGRTAAARGRLDVGGTFSPDGALLAAPAVAGRHRWRIALVDVRTGRQTPVRGSGAANWYPDLAWAPSGWLFIRAGTRVKAYAERAVRLPRSTVASAAG